MLKMLYVSKDMDFSKSAIISVLGSRIKNIQSSEYISDWIFYFLLDLFFGVEANTFIRKLSYNITG